MRRNLLHNSRVIQHSAIRHCLGQREEIGIAYKVEGELIQRSAHIMLPFPIIETQHRVENVNDVIGGGGGGDAIGRHALRTVAAY